MTQSRQSWPEFFKYLEAHPWEIRDAVKTIANICHAKAEEAKKCALPSDVSFEEIRFNRAAYVLDAAVESMTTYPLSVTFKGPKP